MEKSKPKISFVCPVYQGVSFIVQTIESIRGQKMKDIELIIIDDGSTDGLSELMDYYTKLDNRIKYYRFEDNKGAARCRNFGNKKTQADIICVTDCGDIYPSNKARLVYNYFKKHLRIGVFSTGVSNVDHFGTEIYRQITRHWDGTQHIKPNISHPTTSYRKWIALKWPYRETSKATDNYEAFFIILAQNGIKFGSTSKICLWKMQLAKYKDYRNLREARRVKKAVYKEFKIPVPHWLENY